MVGFGGVANVDELFFVVFFVVSYQAIQRKLHNSLRKISDFVKKERIERERERERE